MSDDPPDDNDRSRTTTSFEQWIERQAETQGVSQQELFEQLVSSYWTVNEMAELIDEPGEDPALPTSVSDDADGRGAGSGPSSGAGGSGFEDVDSFDELRERLESLETEFDSGRDLVETLADRVTWLEAERAGERRAGGAPLGSSDPRPEPRGSASEIRERIDAVEDRLEAIEDGLDDEREHTRSRDEFLEAIAEWLSRMEARIDDLASEAEAGRGSLADRLEAVEADVDEVAAEVETVRGSLSSEYESLTDRVDDIESSVDGRHKQLANEQERLRARLNAEFDDLETILEHLVTRTDDLDAGLTAAERRHDDDVSRIRAERNALRSLLSAAAERDVHAGECEACGERIDLDLLADPYCSACDAMLTGIEERDKWLFFSDTVVTAEAGRQAGDAPVAPDERADATRAERGPEATAGALGRTGGTRSPTHSSGGRPDGAEADPARSTDADSETGGARNGAASDDRPAGREPADVGRSDGNPTSADGASESGSGFSFGDLGTGSDPAEKSAPAGGDADGAGSEPDAGRSADAPFGDLEDLKREEQREDGS